MKKTSVYHKILNVRKQQSFNNLLYLMQYFCVIVNNELIIKTVTDVFVSALSTRLLSTPVWLLPIQKDSLSLYIRSQTLSIVVALFPVMCQQETHLQQGEHIPQAVQWTCCKSCFYFPITCWYPIGRRFRARPLRLHAGHSKPRHLLPMWPQL